MGSSGNVKRILIVLSCLFLSAGCTGSRTQESTGEYIDDSVITTRVKTKLLSEEGLETLQISVETFKGTVQLSGFVDTESQREQAETLTRMVKGVQSVRNDIVVK